MPIMSQFRESKCSSFKGQIPQLLIAAAFKSSKLKTRQRSNSDAHLTTYVSSNYCLLFITLCLLIQFTYLRKYVSEMLKNLGGQVGRLTWHADLLVQILNGVVHALLLILFSRSRKHFHVNVNEKT